MYYALKAQTVLSSEKYDGLTLSGSVLLHLFAVTHEVVLEKLCKNVKF